MLKAHNPPILYDTTLRDGAQAQGANISLDDKLKLVQVLVDLGIPYIEAGWPGSNPKDKTLFERIDSLDLKQSKIVAFGSTRRTRFSAQGDPQLQSLINAGTPTITLVAKSSDYHVSHVLKTTLSNNLALIRDSVAFCKDAGKEVIIDAEHFFDGYQRNPQYALDCLQAAVDAGVDCLTLCDTNGGQLPEDIKKITQHVSAQLKKSIGIHCHNDCELAVANSIAAWQGGASLIQGTINGLGERCGNANFCSLIPLLQLKYQQACVSNEQLEKLTDVANHVSNIFNIPLNAYAAFVGRSAFSHKGGIHVSAVEKSPDTYEHINPEHVGNTRNILISELAGKSNIRAQLMNLNLEQINLESILSEVKRLEMEGLDFEEADGTFELLVKRLTGQYNPPFQLLEVNSHYHQHHGHRVCQGMVKLDIEGETMHTIAEADGPIDAIDRAFRLALSSRYSCVNQVKLIDYKVRIINPDMAAAATTRVWIQATDGDTTWSTVGCSQNIIDASSQALKDCFELFLAKQSTTNPSAKRSKYDDKAA